ncbi:hypothetical protein [Rubrivirga marina]|uniref:Uncharacterized protein n=1 Tax=Rubrivirga marina TaxID=1196024 RepID=A0A271IW53_9BACT|nr:hypothetical protein [Rubrivirga marina]PAP75158.1 hypothetical protein BSZ37_01205 [Rubrivirga marina]
MPDVKVTIASDGTPSPSDIPAGPGDTVSFHADGADVVLCIDPKSFFGGARYEIPMGQVEALTVQPDARGSFEFMTLVGDLSAPCKGGRDKQYTGGGGGGGV